MNANDDSTPRFITLDLEQWRQDIQTFAGTTRDALNAIANELSNQCSGRPGSLPSRPVPAERAAAPPGEAGWTAPTEGPPDQRLSKLREQLAERLARK